MTESTPPPPDPVASKKAKSTQAKTKGGAMDSFRGFLIFALLIICAGAGGYFFGTMQKFAPIEYVPPGTPGAQNSVTPAVATTGSSTLKKKYWVKSYGHEHIGYAVTVYINGTMVSKFFGPGQQVEVTQLVKPGENTARFEAQALPPSMNEHKGEQYYKMTIAVESGKYKEDPKPDELISYRRNAAETENFNDTMTFVPME